MKKIGLFILLLGLMSCNNKEVSETVLKITNKDKETWDVLLVVFYNNNEVKIDIEMFLDFKVQKTFSIVPPKNAKYFKLVGLKYSDAFNSTLIYRQVKLFVIKKGKNDFKFNWRKIKYKTEWEKDSGLRETFIKYYYEL